MQEQRLRELIASDPARMQILRHVRALSLPDCWVAAGVIRSLVWDHLHRRTRSPLPGDIDVIWHDSVQDDEHTDRCLEAALRAMDPGLSWSVKNQARMSGRNGDAPYQSASDAMNYWPETATAVAVRLTGQEEIEIAAPFGLEDLFARVIRPTPRFERAKYPLFLDRIHSKRWEAKWPELIVLTQDRSHFE